MKLEMMQELEEILSHFEVLAKPDYFVVYYTIIKVSAARTQNKLVKKLKNVKVLSVIGATCECPK